MGVTRKRREGKAPHFLPSFLLYRLNSSLSREGPHSCSSLPLEWILFKPHLVSRLLWGWNILDDYSWNDVALAYERPMTHDRRWLTETNDRLPTPPNDVADFYQQTVTNCDKTAFAVSTRPSFTAARWRTNDLLVAGDRQGILTNTDGYWWPTALFCNIIWRVTDASVIRLKKYQRVLMTDAY